MSSFTTAFSTYGVQKKRVETISVTSPKPAAVRHSQPRIATTFFAPCAWLTSTAWVELLASQDTSIKK